MDSQWGNFSKLSSTSVTDGKTRITTGNAHSLTTYAGTTVAKLTRVTFTCFSVPEIAESETVFIISSIDINFVIMVF